MRAFRKYHMLNHLEALHLKYFVVRDAQIAKQLGITKERHCYAIRPSLNETSPELSLQISDYSFSQRLFLTEEELAEKPNAETFAKISNLVLNSPIIARNEIEVSQLR